MVIRFTRRPVIRFVTVPRSLNGASSAAAASASAAAAADAIHDFRRRVVFHRFDGVADEGLLLFRPAAAWKGVNAGF